MLQVPSDTNLSDGFQQSLAHMQEVAPMTYEGATFVQYQHSQQQVQLADLAEGTVNTVSSSHICTVS
jgi:hypothetical protein